MAANRSRFIIMLCTLLLGLTMFQTCEGSTYPWPFKTRHVQVGNWLQRQFLNVHCKSKDNDLGAHLLAPGQQFQWKFKVNWSSTTLYFCNLWWDGGHESFEVYYADRVLYEDCGPGNSCQWVAQENGIYMYNAKKKRWEFMYHWDRP